MPGTVKLKGLTSMQAIRTGKEKFMDWIRKRNPSEAEFHQVIDEICDDLFPYLAEHPKYENAQILERLTEPDRIIIFRVTWEDDNGNVQVNRGFRVQMNNAIGPYKGGLRFHPSVNLSIMKFLALEQVLKNSLTTLPLGGAKGGSDFDPKGKSDREIMRFCQSFMTELSRHIGKNLDIPAGDIGVGTREISYLFGQYKRLHSKFIAGTITGKGLLYGGSLIRTEATGYGCVYFAQEMLETKNDGLKDKICLVSGSGNVAQFAAEKLIQLGAKVVTMSDSSGFIYDPKGIDEEKLQFIIELKTKKRERISKYAEKYKCEYFPDQKPWGIKADFAFPCATQNEIDLNDAKELLKNGVMGVCEGANMPTVLEGSRLFVHKKILYAPSKAANAGGVAVSGMEQAQNAMRISWSRKEVDKRLKDIMTQIHKKCVTYGKNGADVNYVRGANIAGFVKVANAMLSYGIV